MRASCEPFPPFVTDALESAGLPGRLDGSSRDRLALLGLPGLFFVRAPRGHGHAAIARCVTSASQARSSLAASQATRQARGSAKPCSA